AANFRGSGTYVAPYYRTPSNGIPFDNLSYRGYPSQQPGYVSPRHYGSDSNFKLPKYDFMPPSRQSLGSSFGSGLQTMPSLNRSYRTRSYGF
ncbi:MAG: hypothetical protein HYU33_01215, partial [Candidatus Omnitrophica bacterium]|nr:hypothetical protein [Candidatus Omnitrophota bacterium]